MSDYGRSGYAYLGSDDGIVLSEIVTPMKNGHLLFISKEHPVLAMHSAGRRGSFEPFANRFWRRIAQCPHGNSSGLTSLIIARENLAHLFWTVHTDTS